MTEIMPLFFSLYMAELAKGSVDGGDIRKGVVVFSNDLLKIHHLSGIYHTDQHEFIASRVHSLYRDDRTAVVQCAHQLLSQLLGMGGDDLKFRRRTRTLENRVADLTADEHVHRAKDHRLILHIVNEERNSRHHHVENKDHPNGVVFGILMVDERADDVGTACRTARSHRKAVERSVEQSPRNGGKDRIACVLRLIDNRGNIHTLQQDQSRRKHNGIGQCSRGIGSPQDKKCNRQHGKIDDQRKRSHLDAKQILHHGGKAVESRWSKIVREYEDLIDQRG